MSFYDKIRTYRRTRTDGRNAPRRANSKLDCRGRVAAIMPVAMRLASPQVKVDEIQRNFPKNKDDDGSFFRQMPFGPDFPTNPSAVELESIYLM